MEVKNLSVKMIGTFDNKTNKLISQKLVIEYDEVKELKNTDKYKE